MLGALMGPAMGAPGAYAGGGYGPSAGTYGAAPSPFGGLAGQVLGAGRGTPMIPGATGGATVKLGSDGRPLPPGAEAPTPVPLPDEHGADQNQGAIVAAILGGSALLGVILGCALFRNKGETDGDSDSDADSEDDDSDESE
jgi:hypothetical protein